MCRANAKAVNARISRDAECRDLRIHFFHIVQLARLKAPFVALTKLLSACGYEHFFKLCHRLKCRGRAIEKAQKLLCVLSFFVHILLLSLGCMPLLRLFYHTQSKKSIPFMHFFTQE